MGCHYLLVVRGQQGDCVEIRVFQHAHIICHYLVIAPDLISIDLALNMDAEVVAML
jgi:hypothetical protein